MHIDATNSNYIKEIYVLRSTFYNHIFCCCFIIIFAFFFFFFSFWFYYSILILFASILNVDTCQHVLCGVYLPTPFANDSNNKKHQFNKYETKQLAQPYTHTHTHSQSVYGFRQDKKEEEDEEEKAEKESKTYEARLSQRRNVQKIKNQLAAIHNRKTTEVYIL